MLCVFLDEHSFFDWQFETSQNSWEFHDVWAQKRTEIEQSKSPPQIRTLYNRASVLVQFLCFWTFTFLCSFKQTFENCTLHLQGGVWEIFDLRLVDHEVGYGKQILAG